MAFARYYRKPAATLTLVLLTFLPSPAILLAAEDTPSEQQLAELVAAIAEIEASLEQSRQQQPEFEQQLRQSETRLAEHAAQVAETRSSIQLLNDRLATLQQQQQALAAQRDRQLLQVKALLRNAYMEGPQSALKLALNQQDPATAARMLYYYRHVNAHRMSRVEDFERTLTNLEIAEIEAQEANSALLENNRRLALQLEDLERDRDLRQLALSTLEESISARGAELQKLQEDRDALDALLRDVQRAVENIPVPGSDQPFARRQGQLTWPGEGPVLSRYGESYGNGELRRQGITIGAEPGDPVRAVHGGRVVFANWLRGSGLLIIVDHGDGYMSLYGHNETLAREQGDPVTAGELIATAGDSGGQPEPGIYFEIRYNGRPLDPSDWLNPDGRE